MKIAALVRNQSQFACWRRLLGDHHRENNLGFQVPSGLEVGSSGRLVAEADFHVLDPVSWTHVVEVFADTDLDVERFAGLDCCRCGKHRGMLFSSPVFFAGSLTRLIPVNSDWSTIVGE